MRSSDRRVPRARHPLTADEEHGHLVAGSRLFNRRQFFETHEEWEEVWRRSSGGRRELLRGLIQVAVGYEHDKRGNVFGTRSLLRQGVRRLRPHGRRAGVRELLSRVDDDLQRLEAGRRLRPPKVKVRLRGFDMRAPAGAIDVEVPRGQSRGPGRRMLNVEP